MKIARGHPKGTITAVLAAVLLSGCTDFPDQSQQYHPLDSEVAKLAAPEAPAPAAPLFCRIGRGDAHFSRGWSPYVDGAFSLAPDSRVTVPLARKSGDENVNILAFFDAAGQKLIFCPIVDGPPDKRVACTSLYALDDDLKAGIKRTFDVPSAIRGAEITCAYEEGALHKI